jgi:hypothetical protein
MISTFAGLLGRSLTGAVGGPEAVVLPEEQAAARIVRPSAGIAHGTLLRLIDPGSMSGAIFPHPTGIDRARDAHHPRSSSEA